MTEIRVGPLDRSMLAGVGARIRASAAAVVLAATASLAASACSQTVNLPTWCGPGKNCVDVELIDAPKGVLHAQAGCIWLSADALELRIEWPNGYTAQTSPFEVRNPAGVVVARDGSMIRFNHTGAGPPDECGRTLKAAVSFGAAPTASG